MSARETLTTDLLVVGGGPAGLAAALHFRRLAGKAARAGGGGAGFEVMVVEKGADFGAHTISGAVIDARPLAELLAGGRTWEASWAVPVRQERLALLTHKRALHLPWVPGGLSARGLVIVSLGRLVRRLAEEAEAQGVQLAAGFAASEPLVEGGTVVGVRTGESGRDRAGRPKAAFQAGVDIRARLTIVAEGACGSLTRELVRRFTLDEGRQAATYALGFKELWEVPGERVPAGSVLHTLGHPLDNATYGGGFLYGLGGGLVAVGLVIGLDYKDPRLDPLERFEAFKAHECLRVLLAGGRRLRFGARTLAEGGWHAAPRPYGPGFLLAGESAGFLDARRLKGVHLALRSGMLAAETALDALLADDTSTQRVAAYGERLAASDVGRDLWLARNFRQGFSWGRRVGLLHALLQSLSAGHGLRDPLAPSGGPAEMRRLGLAEEGLRTVGLPSATRRVDRPLAVSLAGATHEEDQPIHLRVADPELCVTRCTVEYGHPCERFCPAGVYEIVVDAAAGSRRLLVHAANCLHCKTCEIMDPYRNVTWVPPEGSGGPRYEGM